MAELELRFASLNEHGFPHICMTCGNDENPELVTQKMQRGGVSGLGCLLLVFGPLGLFLLLILALTAGKSKKMAIPLCECCVTARRKLNNRVALIAFIGIMGFGCGVSSAVPVLDGPLISLGLLTMCWAAIEYAWLAKQFVVKTLKVENDRILVDVPNEDYPGLYQRHQDTALLYGTTNTLGMADEDEF